MNLCELPDDILLEIFKRLPAQSLVKIAAVSKNFYLLSRRVLFSENNARSLELQIKLLQYPGWKRENYDCIFLRSTLLKKLKSPLLSLEKLENILLSLPKLVAPPLAIKMSNQLFEYELLNNRQMLVPFAKKYQSLFQPQQAKALMNKYKSLYPNFAPPRLKTMHRLLYPKPIKSTSHTRSKVNDSVENAHPQKAPVILEKQQECWYELQKALLNEQRLDHKKHLVEQMKSHLPELPQNTINSFFDKLVDHIKAPNQSDDLKKISLNIFIELSLYIPYEQADKNLESLLAKLTDAAEKIPYRRKFILKNIHRIPQRHFNAFLIQCVDLLSKKSEASLKIKYLRSINQIASHRLWSTDAIENTLPTLRSIICRESNVNILRNTLCLLQSLAYAMSSAQITTLSSIVLAQLQQVASLPGENIQHELLCLLQKVAPKLSTLDTIDVIKILETLLKEPITSPSICVQIIQTLRTMIPNIAHRPEHLQNFTSCKNTGVSLIYYLKQDPFNFPSDEVKSAVISCLLTIKAHTNIDLAWPSDVSSALAEKYNILTNIVDQLKCSVNRQALFSQTSSPTASQEIEKNLHNVDNKR